MATVVGQRKYWDGSECSVSSKSFIVPLWTILAETIANCTQQRQGETKQGSKNLLRVTAVLSHDGLRPAQVSSAAASLSGGQCFTSQHRDRLPLYRFKRHFNQILEELGTRWCSWLRHCATTSRKVVGSIPDGVIGTFHLYTCNSLEGPPLWSSGQSFWLKIQRSRVRFPALPDFLSSSGSGTGSTQPREVN